MEQFKDSSVIDGDTFDVTPKWQWHGNAGDRVLAAGYDAPELHAPGGQAAKQRLEGLILGKTVGLGSAYKIDRGRLVCEVYINGRNLAEYFSGYK